MRKTAFVSMLVLTLVLILSGCGSSVTGSSGIPDPNKIVPIREILIENLEDSGYVITAPSTVEGSDLIVDRIVAQKGSKFIDIVYGLSAEDASTIFDLYCERLLHTCTKRKLRLLRQR